MLMVVPRGQAIRTLKGWATSVLLEAGAIRECEEHGWMMDRADQQAHDRAPSISPAEIRRPASRPRRQPL
jgi:hypothetical protein